MKKSIIANATLASVLALVMAVGVAHAEIKVDAQITNGTQNEEHPGVKTGIEANDTAETRDAKKALIKADAKMRANADEIRAFLQGNNPEAPLEPVVIRRDTTAEAMLKTDVVDANGKKVATVDDILLDDNGRPTKVIVSQGGVMGVGGKKAAFDYSAVKPSTNEDGKRVVTGLTEASIKSAPEAQEPAAKVAKVSEILDGSIVDAKGDKVADIQNVAFNGSDAQLIVKFNDTFGMGGDLAAMNIGTLERVDANGEVNYRLSEAQSVKFKNYKAAVE